MKKEELLHRISELLLKIETENPGLYKSLDEEPITLNTIESNSISNAELENYLESLKQKLIYFKQNH